MGAQPGNVAVHQWRFFRSGGFDQVRIDTADDLRHLAELDQKLWSVLACPTSGLEFDRRTLELLDTDDDGHIRAPEIIAAVRWTCTVLKDPGVLFAGGEELTLATIDDSHPEGAQLLATSRRILAYLGKEHGDAISVADASDHTRLFAADHFNGDGIVPPQLATTDTHRMRIEQVIRSCGSETDRSGEQGITREHLDHFFAQVSAAASWWNRAERDPAGILPLGEHTAAAAALFDTLQGKIDDYFTRCRLASYDPTAVAPLNPAEGVYVELGDKVISAADEEIAALPLARIGARETLALDDGINPAWVGKIADFRARVIAPILGDRAVLSETDWQALSEKFGAYHQWMRERPDGDVVALGRAYLEQVLSDDTHAALKALIARDQEIDAGAEMVETVERLVRYRRDLVTLLRNFVSLADFYAARSKAIFQAGTLYLDRRSCELCLRVGDMDRHGVLGDFSGACLAYCHCVRKGSAPINIVAALTGGDADDLLMVGRNGVFYDRQGRDWNATVVKIVENPISVSQAFWTPYKRIGRMINEQIRKFAESRDRAIEERSAAGVGETAENAASGGATSSSRAAFDIAKFAGIFAAIGLALGALGTALAAIIAGLLSLPAWQLPVVFAGVILLISGPSMLLAWLTLRRRSLGPLLDANGWAVNTHAKINIPFGASLTGVARLPPGSVRSLDDPYAEKTTSWKTYLVLVIVVAIVVTLWGRGAFSGLLL